MQENSTVRFEIRMVEVGRWIRGKEIVPSGKLASGRFVGAVSLALRPPSQSALGSSFAVASGWPGVVPSLAFFSRWIAS